MERSDPPLPDLKPAVPGNIPNLSRALSADETTLQNAIELYEFHKLKSSEHDLDRFRDPLVRSLVTWLSITSISSNHSFAEIQAFLDNHPDWPAERTLRRRAEVALAGEFYLQVKGTKGLDDGDVARLSAWFEKRPPLTSQGAGLWAQALLAKGQTKEAADLIRESWIKMDFNSVQEARYRQKFAAYISAEDDRARFDEMIWRRKSAAALRQGKRLGQGYAALATARMHLAQRRPGVDAAIGRVPDSLQDDPGLIYDRLLWRTRKGRYDSVMELLVPLDETVPYPERWWKIRNWAARKALGDQDPRLAYDLVTAHGLTSGIGFAESEWLAGWISLRRLDNPEQAYEHFVRLYRGVSTVISRSRGAYWAGRAASAQGKDAIAQDWYRAAAAYDTTFYGQLAARELPLAIDAGQGLAQASRNQITVTDFEQAIFERSQLVEIVHLLGRINARDLQAAFLRHLRDGAKDGKDFLLAAQLATAMNRPDIALSTAKTAQQRGYHLHDQLYPHRSLPADLGPEEALVLSVIRQESAFNATAISHAGARGLMQIMPATAKLTAAKAGQSYNRAWLIDDPDYNIHLGQFYLQSLIEDFDGSYILALASYNAGPGRALRWIREFGDPRDPDVDPVDWIEQIPFNETRNYVQRVLENLTVYRAGSSNSFNSWAARDSDSPS